MTTNAENPTTVPSRSGDDGLNGPLVEEPTPATPDPDPDQAWKALTLVNDWIKHAETKVGLTLAATGASGVILYNLVKDRSDPGPLVTVLAAVSGVALVAAALCSALALLPRLRITRTSLPQVEVVLRLWPIKIIRAETDTSNRLFYDHIAKEFRGDAPRYVDVFATLTSNDVELTRHIAHQVHANSTVARRKYVWANRALLAFFLDVATLAILAAIIGSGGR